MTIVAHRTEIEPAAPAVFGGDTITVSRRPGPSRATAGGRASAINQKLAKIARLTGEIRRLRATR